MASRDFDDNKDIININSRRGKKKPKKIPDWAFDNQRSWDKYLKQVGYNG